MTRRCLYSTLFPVALLFGGEANTRTVRVTGTVQAIHTFDVRAPMVQGQGGNVTITRLAKNGAFLHRGEVIVQFDDTAEQRSMREAQSKYDDLAHQVEQKRAEDLSNAEKRSSDLAQAKADLEKARIDIRKGPILSQIEQEKNAVKLADAQARVASLEKSGAAHDRAEAAEVRILELQRDRQVLALERSRSNIGGLSVKAPMDGMLALQNTWKQGAFGHAAEGDQLWPGSPIARIFDPREVEVDVSISEADRAVLAHLTKATVRLDAYPGLAFPARFDSASPVATSNLGVPIKNFSGRFIVEQSDPHLLPDMSAAVDVQVPKQ